jgi:hypothetical protein
MKRQRPPWERFANWLRRQPRNREVGSTDFMDSPLDHFLWKRRIMVTVGTFDLFGAVALLGEHLTGAISSILRHFAGGVPSPPPTA